MRYFHRTLIYAGLLTFPTWACAQETNSEAHELYVQHCAQCHGDDFRGEGGMAQSLVDGVWQFGAARDQIITNIRDGITERGMPAYGDTLSDAQIETLAQYLDQAEVDAGAAPPEAPTELETLDYIVDVEVFAEGLSHPWAIAFIDADTVLVNERPGRVRVFEDGVMRQLPVEGTPTVLHQGQGGLMDIAIDPDYEENGWIYLAYSHALEDDGRGGPAMTRLVRGRIEDNRWVDQQVIYEADHDLYLNTRHHYGCRIVFTPEGHLYFGIGERGHQDHAQDLSRPNGKIHRIWPDGSIPDDNPFLDDPDALPSIFSYGVRNPQGLSVHPETGEVWETEHGPQGGDELNLIKAGNNYGWPVITYGWNYNNSIITDRKQAPGMEQPIFYWRPSPALCGMEFYSGDEFELWDNHLLVTALRFEEVRLVDVVDSRVLHDEVILKDHGRVRDVGVSPDGSIYVATENPGRILRLTARERTGRR